MSESVIEIGVRHPETILCSYLGMRILSGDTEAVKGLYGHIWMKNPALLKTATMLQERLTAYELENDKNGAYCKEFLYYWGMLCIGEQSNLTFKDLGAAKSCFGRIKNVVPKVEARIAYIQLLESDEPIKSDNNVERLDMLRRWASWQDMFSRIVLAKILFYQYLNDEQPDGSELPIRVVRLLKEPCQIGHPVAVRLWNKILDCTESSAFKEMRIGEANIDKFSLFDYEMCANIQIRP